jgi:hypothetical protein
MEEAKNKLEQAKNQAEQNSQGQSEKLEEIGRRQKVIKEQTEELKKEVEKGGAQNQSAGQHMGKAAQSQGQAQQSAQEGKAQQTQGQVEQAIKELKKAKEELEKQKREEMKEAEMEAMKYIEEILKAILEKQIIIKARTREVDADITKDGKVTQEHNLRASELAKDEETLTAEMKRLKEKIKEENAIIFIFAFQRCIDYMKMVSDMLKQVKVDKTTQELQEEIIRQLKELIEAFDLVYRELAEKGEKGEENKGEENKNEGGEEGKEEGGGGENEKGEQKKEKLIPDEIQLNLFKKMQESIFKSTESLEQKMTDNPKEIGQADRDVLKLLKQQQVKIADLLRDFIKEIEDRQQSGE